MSKRNRKRTITRNPPVNGTDEPTTDDVPADETTDPAASGDDETTAVGEGTSGDDAGGHAADAETASDTGAASDEGDTADEADVPDADVPDVDPTSEDAGDVAIAASAGRTRRARRSGGSGAATPQLQSASRSIWSRLYHGETTIDFVGRRRLWFTISLVAVLISLVSFATRGLNLGIDFEGGVVWETPAGDASVEDARDAVDEFGLAGATITELDSDEGREIRVEAEELSAEEADEVRAALAELTGASSEAISFTQVGATWGEEISEKAIRALVVFMVLVTIYISFRFELKMALATLAALIHDVIITVGVYSVTQLEVTPATVIAVLTILGYSIYDGIVVFDKVDENTRLVSSTGGLSYGGMVNVSLNQALMRSLNTTITALLPVGSLLVVGSWMLGAAVLEEFAVALLIGLFSGAYSSIFIASPMLALLKEREPRYRDIKRRIDERGGDTAAVAATIATGRPPSSRGATTAASTGAGAGAGAGDGGGGRSTARSGGEEPVVAPSGRVIPPRPRKKSRGRR